MKIRLVAAPAAFAAFALVLSACTSGDAGTSGEQNTSAATNSAANLDPCSANLGITETADDEISYTAGPVDWDGYNSNTADTYSTYNAAINDRMFSGFMYMGSDGTKCRDESFGHFEPISGVEDDGPLVIEYTIADEAVWSDGTPVTMDDFLLDWATQNPEFLAPGYASGEDPEAQPVFNHVSSSFAEYVPEGPQGEIGSKTFTVEYKEKNPDWEIMISSALPAHVVAEQNGMTTEELSQAIIDRDAEKVASTADFWNNWLSPNKGELPDPAIAPSMGPYQLMENGWVAGQYITLEANPNYWGEPAATQRLTFRFISADAAPQSLANGELNVVEPQATVDTLDQFKQLGDSVKVDAGALMTWEHLDFNFIDDSIFSDAKGGLKAREAFAYCMPRQAIVDNLIKPIDPEAVVMNAREVFPFQSNYADVLATSYDGRYDEVDLEAAKKAFAESGLEEGVEVRIGYQAPNPRRAEQVAQIKASCDQVGFNIVDGGSQEFFSSVMPSGDYEAALFAWAGSGQITSGMNIYSTNAAQNYGQYSNAKVDEAWKVLAASLDPEVQQEQVKVIEKELWDSLFGLPIFAHPGVIAYSSDLSNVLFNATQSGVVWNSNQWLRATK